MKSCCFIGNIDSVEQMFSKCLVCSSLISHYVGESDVSWEIWDVSGMFLGSYLFTC